jgi:hypothetical protein
MVLVELSAIRAGVVGEDFILNFGALFRAACPPSALIQQLKRKGMACTILYPSPVDVL